MKKKDFLLIIILLAIAGSTYLGYRYVNEVDTNGEGTVIIKIDDEVYGKYPLGMETKIEIPGKLGHNILEIKDGKAKMIEASCPDLICVKQRSIHNATDRITCLPNRIVVTIDSTNFSEIDSIVE